MKGERDDEIEFPGCSGGKGHADISDVERKGFGGVREWHRSFARRVDHHEEIDSDSHARETGISVTLADPE